MPRKPKLDATLAPGEAAAPQADTQVVAVFADLPTPDVEDDATFYDDDSQHGYSEADNPSNGWQLPDMGSDQDNAPDAGLAYGPDDLGTQPTEAAPPVAVAPAPQVDHLARLNAMTRGELMAYAAEELGIRVRDTNPKPKIIDTIMGVLVKDHVPGSIKASVVAHRSVGGGATTPGKPKLPQAKMIAVGLACPVCGTFLAQEDGRTTWTIGQDVLPDTHTCACGVTMQTPKELHAPPVAPAVPPATPQVEAVAPAEATPTDLAATDPQAVAA